MNTNAENLLKKAVKFFFTSGIGFVLDFCSYTYMTQKMDLGVLHANFISSLIGATFVFFVSTHKIFNSQKSRLPLPMKYFAYIVYQLLLISLVSLLGEQINLLIHAHFQCDLLLRYSKLMCKVVITPVTMTCNFLVMRFLSERI